MKRASEEDRFFSKVREGNGGCWEWSAYLRAGYGMFRYSGQMGMAYRWAYEFMVGDIPDGLHLDHLCRNRSCVNPSHLDPVPNSVNSARTAGHRTLAAHCPKGHAYSPENTYRDGKYRKCKACSDASSKRYYASKKGRPE